MTLGGRGYCLEDGPFAGTQIQYFDPALEDHCLSRNFRNDSTSAHFTGHLLRPDLLNSILDEEELSTFIFRLEVGPHNTIPQAVGGDFLSFTAPAGQLAASLTVVFY